MAQSSAALPSRLASHAYRSTRRHSWQQALLPELLPQGGIFCRFNPGFGTLCLAQNLRLKLSLVFIVICQRRVNLRERQMRVLKVQQFPPMAPMSYVTMMSEESAG